MSGARDEFHRSAVRLVDRQNAHSRGITILRGRLKKSSAQYSVFLSRHPLSVRLGKFIVGEVEEGFARIFFPAVAEVQETSIYCCGTRRAPIFGT
jgi:hypothetical protein